ncbi:MAG: hypothetical protein H6704_13360 [Myxococcales bacterium]|nr:hypothetical protein [Myxococcales bacterium]
MRSTLAGRLTLRGTGAVVAALFLAGALTGALLHVEQARALDRTLLAAAHGEAHPQPVGTWSVEHASSPVEVWHSPPGDPRVPADLRAAALDSERPRFADVDDHRLLLLVAEAHEGRRERHAVVAARAPRATARRTLGTFAGIYALVALGTALATAFLLRRGVRAALTPFDQVQREAARVTALGSGARLTEQGPREVRALIAAMNGVLERLDDAFHAQSRFTAEAAHELRTPVTILLGELDVALRRPRSADDYRETLTTLRATVERLRAVVAALTDLARIDAGEVEQVRDTLDAAELARAAAGAEAATLEAAGCPLTLDLDEPLPVRAHAALVETALANLLRNAARYAAGAPVTLRARRDGDRVRLEVDDGGPGVPADAREALFDRFARGPEARRRHREGLGLGLPLAREVAARHGGGCWLEDAPGGGCRAVLTVAAAEEG